jgi:hypothetical protein
MNVLAALLANAQLLESAFEGESPDTPLLAGQPPESREQALIAVRHVVETSHELVALLKKS